MCRSQSLRMCLALVSLFPVSAMAADKPLDGFDKYVTTAMKQWSVPGVAAAVVKDGTTVLCRGYGVRKLGQKERVTAGTRFPIASCTKSFTALALGLLADRKKLHWDDPVRKHLPAFQLYDVFLTRETTIRDLLANRTGLEAGNHLWSKNEFTSDEIMRRLRHLKSKHSFRSRFVYNNLMYLAAGRVVEKASGQSWDKFIQAEILQPLAMQKTTTGFPVGAGVAWPHAEIERKVRPIKLERHYSDCIAPAGAMWSSAADMANWIRLNLARGQRGKRRLIRETTLNEMHSPQIFIPTTGAGKTYPKKLFRSYGIGWFVEEYRGRKLVWHGGSRNGYVAWVAMLPDERLGFVILANVHRTGINFAMHHRILDTFLGQAPKDWSSIVWNDYSNGWKKSLKNSKSEYNKRRRQDTKPTVKMAAFAGTYRSDLYGDLAIRSKNKSLELRFGPRRITTLQHWQDNKFLARFPNPILESWEVSFTLDKNGTAASLRARAAPWAPMWYDDSVDLGTFLRVATMTE